MKTIFMILVLVMFGFILLGVGAFKIDSDAEAAKWTQIAAWVWVAFLASGLWVARGLMKPESDS